MNIKAQLFITGATMIQEVAFPPNKVPIILNWFSKKKRAHNWPPTPLYYGFRLSAMYCIHIVAFTIVYVSFCSVPLGVKISAHQ